MKSLFFAVKFCLEVVKKRYIYIFFFGGGGGGVLGGGRSNFFSFTQPLRKNKKSK